MSLRLFVLPSATGLPSMQRFVLAPEDRADVEIDLARILAETAQANPRFEWPDAQAALTAAGFIVPDSTWLIEKPWDDSRRPVATSFFVEFPADAPHEHAGKRLTATTAIPGEDGLPVLIDDQHQLLNATDRLWSRDDDGLAFEVEQLERRPPSNIQRPTGTRTQVPLGPVVLPARQFARPEDHVQAKELLAAAGFEVLR